MKGALRSLSYFDIFYNFDFCFFPTAFLEAQHLMEVALHTTSTSATRYFASRK